MSRNQSTAGLQLLGDEKGLEDRRGLRGWEAPEHPEDSRTPERRERCAASGSFARGVLEAAWIAAIFVALGLAYAEVLK
jgi:hypothetical protein